MENQKSSFYVLPPRVVMHACLAAVSYVRRHLGKELV